MAIRKRNPIIKSKAVVLCVALSVFSVLCVQEACGQNYSSLLVNGLLRLGYTIHRDDVVALDKISMRFNAKNRIDVLTRILQDRHKIHGLEKGDDFEKTEVICNALRLLNEMELPVTRKIIQDLSKEEGWQEKERRLLSYMAARRDIDFASNINYLIATMPRQENDLNKEWGGEISLSIMDICDTLSALTELYVYRGDKIVLDALIRFAGHAYGYPKEYLSHMFVEILLQRPEMFIDVLSEKDEQRIDMVINSLLFAVWRKDSKGKVDILLQEELGGDDYAQNKVVKLFRERLKNLSKHNEAKPQQFQTHH